MTSFTSSSDKLPKGVFLCAALLLATEIVASYQVDYLRPPALNVMLLKRQVLEEASTPDFDMILLGDSRVMGLDARRLSDGISRQLQRDFKVYNFSLPNQGVRGYDLFLQKYLSHKKPPRYILFAPSPIAVSGEWDVETASNRKELLYRLVHMYDVRDMIGNYSLKTTLEICRMKIEGLIKFVIYRKAIRDALDDPAHFDCNYMDEIIPFMAKRNGAYLLGVFTTIPESEVRRSLYFQTPLKPDRNMLSVLDDFFKLARDHDIKVIVAHAPLHELIYDHRQGRGWNEDYARIVRGWGDNRDDVRFIEPILQSYPADNFTDAQHLNPEGMLQYQEKLSTDLMELIGEWEASEALPPQGAKTL